MTSIAVTPPGDVDTDPGSDPDGGPAIRRVSGDGLGAALGLLMTGRADAGDPSVPRFLSFAHEHSLSLDWFYAVYDGQTPLACALIVPGAGRTGVLFTSPVRRPAQVDQLGAVIRHALGKLDPQTTRLIQSLTDAGQKLDRQALLAGGLVHLAELAYMHRFVGRDACSRPIHDPRDGQPIRVVDWSEAARPAFEQAILDSYVGTLDCPGLLGVRTIADIVAGHQAAGRFDPGLWSIFHGQDGRAVAVLLLTEVPAQQAYELVYLGVSEAMRGHKLGSALVDYAMAAVALRGGGRLHLAVDQRNLPALRLYKRHGFHANAHKTAMIRTLEELP